MEDSLASQLPEADALPDGFAESFCETSDCTASTVKSDEKSNIEQEDKVDLDKTNSANELRTQESETGSLFIHSCIQQVSSKTETDGFCIDTDTGSPISENRVEKTERERTFPVPLSDKDAVDFSDNLAESSREDCLGDRNMKHEDTILESTRDTSDAGYISSTEYQSIPDVQLSLSATDRSSAGLIHTTSDPESVKKIEREEVEISPEIDWQNCVSNPRSLKQMTKNLNQDVDNVMPNPVLETQEENNSEVKVKQTKGTAKLERELMELHQKYLHVIVEKDSANLELRKNVAVREKLESLCRELQRQNKVLTDECRKVSTEGQEKRLELSNKFQDAIKDINIKLEEQRDERLSQLKENEMLREKLKEFSEKFEICEHQFMQQLKKKTLELQLAELKLQQQQEACSQEQAKVQLYAEQITQLLATEKNLRLQLAADGEKFQQFQDTLTKSNDMFETFKKEMEKMTKTIKELNKENNFLKSKCEKTDVTLIELVDERAKLKKQLEKTKNQKEKLEALCRSLQAERKQQGAIYGINGTIISDSLKEDRSTGEDPGRSI